MVMNLKIKFVLCALNRQSLGFHGALYSSMSAAISRYTTMDPQGWVSSIRTPCNVKLNSTVWDNLAVYDLETTHAILLLP